MKILINCTGFIGDILFSTSVAKKIKLEQEVHTLDYLIHLYQPYTLLSNDPDIDNVYLFDCDKTKYDRIIELSYIDFTHTPTEYYQTQSGIKNPSPEYYVHSLPSFDKSVKYTLKPYNDIGKIIVAYMSNWEERSFLFTEEEYKHGIDVPNLGYGGKHRNIDFIIQHLSDDPNIILLPIGMEPGFNVKDANFQNTADYTMQASLLKSCDYFIGAEGGLCNLAAGVGCKTIITGDFIHQLYGWNGVLRKIREPKLGPKYYFKDKHITLDPYLTDKQVVTSIKQIINGGF